MFNLAGEAVGRGPEGLAILRGIRMDSAYRALACGIDADELADNVVGDATRHLSLCQSADLAVAMTAFISARNENRPFEVVIVAASAAPDALATFLDVILAADVLINIVVVGAAAPRAGDRVVVVSALEQAAARNLIMTLARHCRTRRELIETRAELETAHRAARVVSAEFKRQNVRLAEHEQQLSLQNQRFDAALNNMSQGLCMFDAEARVVVSNRRYIEMYRLSAEVMRPGCPLQELLRHRKELGNFSQDVDEYCAALLRQIAEGSATEQIAATPDGRTIAIVNQPMEGGGWVATHEDITERTLAEAKIKHMARHDALTELPNRTAFHDAMELALVRIRRNATHAVLCLDLDQFKGVNDTLGHPVGDALLRAVSARLKACLRESDTVARLGGDEFAVLQTDLERPEDAGALAQRLIRLMEQPFELDDHQVVIGTSIGIAVAPHDGRTAEELMRNADMALYRAKADGRSTYRFFETQMDAQLQARRVLELDLRQALAQGEFDLFYQPLLSAQSEEITSCEALLRWRHPERGMISPADFIPLAEEIGLIVPIGEWVLSQACTEAASWPVGISLAVNLSPAQFKSRTLVQTVVNALARSGLDARRLELEITESVLLADNEATIATLHQLRDLGVRISMDDFGTGYSSLSYLRSFPFDKIKIDRSFVRDLSAHGDCAAIIKAVTGLGRGLGMTTTAEGVETREQLEQIRQEGCNEVQGFLFSAPKPAVEIREFIRQRTHHRRVA
jgi:diguanylate cyclase (GGDEF)-like protein